MQVIPLERLQALLTGEPVTLRDLGVQNPETLGVIVLNSTRVHGWDVSAARAALVGALREVAAHKRATPLDQARKLSRMANSHTRLTVIVQHFSRLPRLEWFRLLGEGWTICDNIAFAAPKLRWVLSYASRAELDAMMEPREITKLSELPDRITIYRGCYPINRRGLSWTLDRSIAEGFPRLMRYRRPGERPILRIGTARRDRVVLKLDREEQEIIAHHVWNIREEPLEPDDNLCPRA